jgi:hypothetical protein
LNGLAELFQAVQRLLACEGFHRFTRTTSDFP